MTKQKQGRKSHTLETAQAAVTERRGEGIYEISGEWVNSSTKVCVKHIPCGFEWMTTQSSLMTKEFCPGCNLTGVSKKPLTIEERAIIVDSQRDETPSTEGYFVKGFEPKKYDYSKLYLVYAEIGEMDVIKAANSKFKRLPIVGLL